ncbi:hypothetical protein [Lentzea sp. NEAU-D7]|uniref:hypothetical protein n=1 Tax=Lentzea sp. NEAU-D7 TaxID=2994667 RepID=UPI00224B40EC|nr:hypothetical protein [Lentzea sp. NEAU-D7]MCX2950564.1 hypothetical protein [Lentzea sp. NEAU-D7]
MQLWQPAGMPELRVHAGRHYAVQFIYALPDDSWCVELSEAVPAPASWAGIPDAKTHLPGDMLMAAVVPDEDPSLEPTIHVHTDEPIPYAIMRWFMDHVTEQVEHCRRGFEQAAAEASE